MSTKHTLTAATLLLLACGDRSSPPAPTPAGSTAPPKPIASAGAAAPAASSAAVQAARAQGPKATVITALQSKGRKMRLSLDRDGDELRAYLVNDASAQGVELRGKMLDERRFRLNQAGRSKQPASLEGEIDGNKLGKLTFHEGKTRPVALSTEALTPFGAKDDKSDLGYSGSIGEKLHIRAQVVRDGKSLTGYYRYARSRDDLKLAGSIDPGTGKFEMTETGTKGAATGRLKGTFLDSRHLVGTWESTDGTRSMPLRLEATKPLPKVLELAGGIKIVPRESERAPSPSCTMSASFPEFDGLSDKKAQAELNKIYSRSRTFVGHEKELCEGATADTPYTFEEDYSVTSTKHAGFVGISTGGYEYTGGAHGMPYSRCSVVDLSKGKSFELHEMLAPDALARLTELANRKLKEENKVSDLTEAGFFDAQIKVNEKPDLCLNDTGVELVFAVYEVAPYAAGSPTATFTTAEIKPLFKKEAVIDALFK